MRRPAISPTRRVIDAVVELLAPHKALETNIHATPTAAASDLDPARQDFAPFRFLLETIRPAIIVTHGKDAAAALEAISTSALVVNEPHFSRAWATARATLLGRRQAGILEDLA